MRLLFIAGIILCSCGAGAQNRPDEWYPPRNKPVPAFNIGNLVNYSSSEVSNISLSGKWYMLEFWNTGCAACIASFPKIESMKDRFKGRMNFFLVGIGCPDTTDQKRRLDSIYSASHVRVPYAAALVLGKRWGICTAPDIVIIDDKGIVRAHTFHFKAEQLDSLLNGQNPHFDKFYNEIEY